MQYAEAVIDYERLLGESDSLAQQFQNADPFPHIVIDDFISPEVVSRLNAEFPDFDLKKRSKSAHIPVILDDGTEAQLGKEWMSREQLVPQIYRRLYWELNSYPFVGWLEQITGINGLLADPHLRGGGVHRTQPGGYLKVHADFNKHPNFGLDRRLNLLIYLNEDWLPEYGGDLELWSQDMERCVHSVSPVAGRCVIFRTTSTSFHGHPRPLTCPPDRSRCSVALYYYSNGRGDEEQHTPEHGTLWQEVPG
jgi:Rps23 Pro-64 3,4-dihydroxylase Tpa1-like proline 4-hydroxylase